MFFIILFVIRYLIHRFKDMYRQAAIDIQLGKSLEPDILLQLTRGQQGVENQQDEIDYIRWAYQVNNTFCIIYNVVFCPKAGFSWPGMSWCHGPALRWFLNAFLRFLVGGQSRERWTCIFFSPWCSEALLTIWSERPIPGNKPTSSEPAILGMQLQTFTNRAILKTLPLLANSLNLNATSPLWMAMMDMLYHMILYDRILCDYIILYCFVLYCFVLYCIVLYYIILYYIILYYIILYYIILYYIILYYIILYYIILYYIILYRIVYLTEIKLVM